MAVATSCFRCHHALNERSGEQPKSAQADWDAMSRPSADFSYQPELQFNATFQPPTTDLLFPMKTDESGCQLFQK